MSFDLVPAESPSREGRGSPGVGLLSLPVTSRIWFIPAYLIGEGGIAVKFRDWLIQAVPRVTCVSVGLGVCSSFG